MAHTPEPTSSQKHNITPYPSNEAQQQDRRFEATFEQVVVGMAHVSLNGKWLHVNQKLCDIVGYSRDELLHSTFQDITSPDDLKTDLDHAQQLLDGEITIYATEKRYIKKDGTLIWVNLTVSLARDEDGAPQYFISVIEDIHARKQLEEALHQQKLSLQQSQRRLKLAQLVGRIGSFEWDILGNKIIWTPELEALYGLPAGGFEGKYENWLQRVHPDDLKQAEENLQAAASDGPAYNAEFRIIRPDGSIRWILGKGDVFMYNAEGKAQRMVGVNIDITERKEAELQLTRTLEYADFLAEANKILSAHLDYHEALINLVKYMVPTFADWCRIDLFDESSTVQECSIVYPQLSEEEQPTISRPMRAISLTWQQQNASLYTNVTEQTLKTIAQDEQELSLLQNIKAASIIIAPLKSQNNVAGIITLIASEKKDSYTVSDLTMVEELAVRIFLVGEKARAHQRLQELNTNLETMVEQRTEALNQTTETLRQINIELQQSNQELEEFAYVASHDLQEPLRKIQAFGNLLEEEHGEALGEGKLYLDRMRNSAARMRALIQDLLTFSRVTTKALPFVQVDLNEVVHEVVDDLDPRLQAAHGIIEVTELPTIEADPRQMYQMFQNLISNAVKFHRPDVPPLVKIYATMPETSETTQPLAQQTCQIYVEDNGIGFDEKYLDRIFTVFQRLHGKNEYEGTGIGLAVVRKIVERHNGAITANSTDGTGATFIVTLPIN